MSGRETLREVRSQINSRAEEDEEAEVYDGLYAMVRQLDYTWEEALNETWPRILFSLEKLKEESEEYEENAPDNQNRNSDEPLNNPG